jgi:hypothetical protein
VIVAQSVAAECLRHLKHFWRETAHVQIFKLHRNSSDFCYRVCPSLALPPNLDLNATVTSSIIKNKKIQALSPIPAHEDWKKLCQSTPLILKLSLGIFPQAPLHTANCQGLLDSLRFDGTGMQELTACF